MPLLLVCAVIAVFGAWRVGEALAGRIELPRAADPPPGMRVIAARDRDIRRLDVSVLPRERARALLGRAPRGAVLSVAMEYNHPDTGARKASTLFYETGRDIPDRARRELDGYAGPVLRHGAEALRRGGERSAAARLDACRAYRLDAGVTLSLRAERGLGAVADRYHARTGNGLLVTSGTRDAVAQARAMYTKLILGDDVIGLYGGVPAVYEIRAVYVDGRAEKESGAAIQRAMADVIRAQVARGVYISNHLRAGAVDIRSRGLSMRQKRALARAAAAVPYVRLTEEKIPPHFHLQVMDAGPKRPGE